MGGQCRTDMSVSSRPFTCTETVPGRGVTQHSDWYSGGGDLHPPSNAVPNVNATPTPHRINEARSASRLTPEPARRTTLNRRR